MEVAIRAVRIYNRLFRKPIRIIPGYFRNVSTTGTAVKEEVNSELLNSFNQDIKAGGVVPVFRRALLFPTRVALQDDLGTYTYAGLHYAASELSQDIAAQLVGDTERTIAYMCPNDATHVVVQWAIWMSGNIAVPLTSLHPPEMLKYFIQDSSASLVVCTQEYEKILGPIAQEVSKPLLVTTRDDGHESDEKVNKLLQFRPKTDILSDTGRSNMWYGNTEAMLIYTSGTTSKPKGVVWTHAMLGSQVSALHAAWQYSGGDVVLHVLPLHHIHGQLNSLAATLAAGARLRMLPSFASHAVWARLLGAGGGAGGGVVVGGTGGAGGAGEEPPVSVLHGVPAMYARLAADHARMFADARTAQYVRATLAARVRLMCAGSAPLPDKLFHRWEEISGFRLLERYGMSEVGMALSNPYRPVAGRTVGCVGAPLPGVAARVAAARDGVLEPLVTVETSQPTTQISLERLGLSSTKDVNDPEGLSWQPPLVTEHKPSDGGEHQGELLLKGPGVFSRYWNRAPQVSSPDFTLDGWFRTGDTVSYRDGRFRILGRTAVDIIKTGGYKVSALEVESAILDHPNVTDAAVLGAEHESQGEIVVAAVALKENTTLTLKELKDFTGKKLAPYQLPRKLVIVEQMPRNAMGKLDKKQIRIQYGKELGLKA